MDARMALTTENFQAQSFDQDRWLARELGISGPDALNVFIVLASMNLALYESLTDADRDGRDLVVGWMRDLGLQISIDAIGNVIGVMPGADPSAAPVMVGSHIDTVRTGGWFDGNLGVLAGLELVETLMQHGVTPHRGIAVAFFTDEEGARFPPAMRL